MKQLTKEQAIGFADSGLYKCMSYREIAEFQIQQECLCMPFDVFHEAIEKTVGRSVYTHEFGLNIDGIKSELFDGAEPLTFEEVVNLIPEEKRIIMGI